MTYINMKKMIDFAKSMNITLKTVSQFAQLNNSLKTLRG